MYSVDFPQRRQVLSLPVNFLYPMSEKRKSKTFLIVVKWNLKYIGRHIMHTFDISDSRIKFPFPL